MRLYTFTSNTGMNGIGIIEEVQADTCYDAVEKATDQSIDFDTEFYTEVLDEET